MLALEDLIARLERGELVTPVTPRESADVTEKPAPLLAVTPVTPVTPENDNAEVILAAVALQAPPRRGPNPPAPGGLVARIIEAGGVSRIGGFRPDRGLYRTAELPEDAPAELVAELKRERWHVARIIKAARRAVPRPDEDTGEWRGEAEEWPASVPADHGDEGEHDRWLAGTPIAEIGR